MTDQLKIETIARRSKTSLPAMVACSNAKSRPPAARITETNIRVSPAELLADSDESERACCHVERSRDISKYFRPEIVRDSSTPVGMTELRFFWKRRSQFCDDHEGEANRDQEEGKELTAGKTANQARIRLAEIFYKDAKDRVEDEKQTGENAIRLAHSRAHEPEDREQNNAFKESFVKLGWMSRCQNSAQDFFHLRLMTHRGNNRIRRSER